MKSIYTHDELLEMLRNDRNACDAWLELGQQIAAGFFNPVDSRNGYAPSIALNWQLNPLSYSRRQMVGFRVIDMAEKHLTRIMREEQTLEEAYLDHDTLQQVATAWFDMLSMEIKIGAIQPEKATMDTLAVLYGEACGNIAKTCRLTGMTRHHINKTKNAISLEAYTRMQRVANGEAYAIVMGDCAPYATEYPKFTPIRHVSCDTPEEEVQINPGDLVAEPGSSRWYVVGELGQSGNIVYAEDELIVLPCKVLPKQYTDSAARFCGSINRQPPYTYLQDKAAA